MLLRELEPSLMKYKTLPGINRIRDLILFYWTCHPVRWLISLSPLHLITLDDAWSVKRVEHFEIDISGEPYILRHLRDMLPPRFIDSENWEYQSGAWYGCDSSVQCVVLQYRIAQVISDSTAKNLFGELCSLFSSILCGFDVFHQTIKNHIS